MPRANLIIEEMYAFIMVDPDDGSEGIPAFQGADGKWLPLVGADMDRVDSLIPLAEEMVQATGVPIEVVKFTQRETIRVINVSL